MEVCGCWELVWFGVCVDGRVGRFVVWWGVGWREDESRVIFRFLVWVIEWMVMLVIERLKLRRRGWRRWGDFFLGYDWFELLWGIWLFELLIKELVLEVRVWEILVLGLYIWDLLVSSCYLKVGDKWVKDIIVRSGGEREGDLGWICRDGIEEEEV